MFLPPVAWPPVPTRPHLPPRRHRRECAIRRLQRHDVMQQVLHLAAVHVAVVLPGDTPGDDLGSGEIICSMKNRWK